MFVVLAMGQLRYSSDFLSRVLGLGSWHVLQRASGASFGSRGVFWSMFCGLFISSLLCSSLRLLGLGAIPCVFEILLFCMSLLIVDLGSTLTCVVPNRSSSSLNLVGFGCLVK